MNKTIQLFNQIADSGLHALTQAGFEVGTQVDNPQAILLRSHDLHQHPFSDQLLAVARAGAGINNIPHDTLIQRGVIVFNTPGANANAVKELVIGALLIGSRNLMHAREAAQALTGDANELHEAVESIKKQFTGIELSGRTLGVIGLGNIGVLVANAALSLGMNVIGYDPMMSVQNAWKLSAHVQQAASVEDIYQQADCLSIHVPLNEKTHRLINQDSLARMKSGAIIANFSRAGIVDSRAMADALAREHIHRYLCDFPQPELQSIPQAICFPHLGASTIEATTNCATMAAQQLTRFLKTGELKNCIHFPDTQLAPTGLSRMTIINENVPNMVAQISTVLSQHQLNINNMINQSRGQYAYNIFDLDQPIEEAVTQSLHAIKGIIRCRVITEHQAILTSL